MQKKRTNTLLADTKFIISEESDETLTIQNDISIDQLSVMDNVIDLNINHMKERFNQNHIDLADFYFGEQYS